MAYLEEHEEMQAASCSVVAMKFLVKNISLISIHATSILKQQHFFFMLVRFLFFVCHFVLEALSPVMAINNQHEFTFRSASSTLVKYDKHFFQFLVVSSILAIILRLSQQYHLINFSWTSWYRNRWQKNFLREREFHFIFLLRKNFFYINTFGYEHDHSSSALLSSTRYTAAEWGRWWYIGNERKESS